MDEKTHEKFKDLMGDTLIQTTKRGWHFVYIGDPEFFKTLNKKLRDDGYEMELRVAGAYCVVAPSSVNGEVRKWNNKEIIQMPKELKEFFMKYYEGEVKEENTKDEIQEAINSEKLDVVDLSHKRNDTFIKTAGVFRKWMDRETLEKTLSFLSHNWIDKPIPTKELKA
ncbi:MAG: bifunctional DNA primase/polymerase, partial [Nanoarchaeota archaeon]|nr:bifunctional DNA primase/polymerase [Nanoarchaeota archaeon]